MQRLVTYLLERESGFATSSDPDTERDHALTVLVGWLTQKGGARSSDNGGTFVSRSEGGKGSYSWTTATDEERSWNFLSLTETDADGVQFETQVSVTRVESGIIIYATLSAGHTAPGIVPVTIAPSCPHFVRTLLEQSADWYHGESKIQTLQTVRGRESGQWLGGELLASNRALPFVVAAEVGEGTPLSRLPELLARDLAGIANVFKVDDSAAWGMTDELGKEFSCYQGAIRLYWPRFTLSDSLYAHPLWTRNRIVGIGLHPTQANQRLRQQIRRLIMRASVVSVERPASIDEIRTASTRRRIAGLREQARSRADYQELAESYSKENDQLRADLLEARKELDELRDQVRRQSWLLQRQTTEPDDIPPVDQTAEDENPPSSGEVRFYKKISSTRSYDILVQRGDCGHNKWQPAHKADKAAKGVVRLEKAEGWKSMAHCAQCTGGGVWKVVW